MRTTAALCRRLELWSTLQCAGGIRVAIWTQVLAASMTLTLGLDSQLTAQVPMDDPASVALARWNVVRVWEGDTAWDEWVVTDVQRDDTSNVVTLTAAPPTVLLGRTGVVAERTPDGRVRHELDRVGLTPAVLLDTLVIDQLEAQGVTWVQRGVVVPTAVQDLSLAWVTPLQALSALVDACGAELQCRRVGITAYALDVLFRIGTDAPTLDLRAERNLLEFGQAEELTEHATVLTAKGATIDGEGATLAEAVWQVTAVSGTTVALADVNGGPGPIGWDGQLGGLRLELPSGATVAILGSDAGTQVMTCATAPAVSVGQLVRVVDADGADLVALPCPPAVADYGRIGGVLERPDLPGHRNLVPNSVLRTWTGAGSTPPDGWATVGTVVLSRLTTGPQITRGVSALQVVADAAGEGILTPLAPVTTSAARPYLSGYVTLWITTGTVRVELVATTAAGEKVYPLTGNLATSSVTGQQVDLGLAGIDAHAAGITAARLRVVAHSTSGATFIVESAQLTRSAAQLPFVEGSGGNLLWQATNAALEVKAVPRLRTTVRLVDLARLFPATFGPDCTIALGATARVVLPRRGIDGTARIVAVQRNLLVPGDGGVTLSDKPGDITRSLARTTWRARPVPAPPIVVLTGDVQASTAFDAAGALTILVVGPVGADSLRAAVSTSAIPSAASVDAATGSLRADGTEVAALTAPGPFAPGQIVYIAVRAYQAGVGTRVLQLTDAADAADAAQGPSLEVRQATTDTQVTVTYAAIGTVTYRVNDVLTTTPASPFTIARPAAGSRPTVAVLYCTRNGLVQSETIVVPAIGVNTVTPDLVVVPVSSAQLRDSVQFTVSATDPSGAGLTVVRRMTLTGCTAVGFTGAGPHVLSNGQTVTVLKPFARNDATVEFEAFIAGNGRAFVQRSIPAQDLTGAGVEVLSNPEFRADLPRLGVVYDNASTGLVTLSYGAVTGQNASGVELVITRAAGAGTTPGLGGVGLALPRTTAAQFTADAYREGSLYLVSLRALIPIGYTLVYASNPFGTGGTVEALSSMEGTGAYADFVLRIQIGTGGSFGSIGFFFLTGPTTGVVWRIARINWRDLTVSERQPVVNLSARIASSDATTVDVEVSISPATADSRLALEARSDAPLGGAVDVGVEVTAPNLWRFPRRAFRTGASFAAFRGRTPGFEPAFVSIVIPEQGRDTVSLALTAERVGGTETTEVVRFLPTDPFPQGTGTLTLSLLPSTASVSPAGPIALTSGSPVDITITKPASTALPAIVGATLSNPNRVSAYVGVKIEPVRVAVPGRIERLPSAQADAVHTERFRSYRADGTEVTSASDVAVRVLRTPPGGSPIETDPGVTRDMVNGWFTTSVTRIAGHGYSVRLVSAPSNTARSELVAPVPTWQEPASGISDAFSSVSLAADTALNAFVPAFSLAASLSGATVVASIRRTYGGIGPNVPGVEGTSNYTGVVSGSALSPGPFSLVPFGGASTTTYNAQLALAAYIGTTLVGTAFSNVVFYVDNTGS